MAQSLLSGVWTKLDTDELRLFLRERFGGGPGQYDGREDTLYLPLPKFRRNPFARDVLLDPGGMTVPRITALHMLRSTITTVFRSREFIISWLNHTPHATALYASCSASPPPHAGQKKRRMHPVERKLL